MLRCRVKLFNKGDKVSTKAKERKLKREYLAIKKLANLLFFTEMGREGANHIKLQLQNREIAEHMAEMNPDISVERAQKLIKQSIEAQRKADLAKKVRYSRADNNGYVQPVHSPCPCKPFPLPNAPSCDRNNSGGQAPRKKRGRRRNKKFKGNNNGQQTPRAQNSKPAAKAPVKSNNNSL